MFADDMVPFGVNIGELVIVSIQHFESELIILYILCLAAYKPLKWFDHQIWHCRTNTNNSKVSNVRCCIQIKIIFVSYSSG